MRATKIISEGTTAKRLKRIIDQYNSHYKSKKGRLHGGRLKGLNMKLCSAFHLASGVVRLVTIKKRSITHYFATSYCTNLTHKYSTVKDTSQICYGKRISQ